LSGESVQNNKPAPDIYLKSVEKIGIDPIECVALEDSSIGINAAKNAGLETWALNYPGYSSDQSKADYVFNGFGEVCNYFEKVKKI
jgi:beta-phosphoglucomutase-like phosphatase (HAD superfamily)